MRKKTLFTRRRRALRQLAILLAAVLFAAIAAGYGFLPRKAIRQNEQKHLIEKNATVFSARAVSGSGVRDRYYLSETRDCILLSAACFEPFVGWQLRCGCALNTPPDMVIHKEAVQSSSSRGVANLFFGRFDDSAVKTAALCGDFGDDRGMVEISRDFSYIPTENGTCFFLDLPAETLIRAAGEKEHYRAYLVFYGADGEKLCTEYVAGFWTCVE